MCQQILQFCSGSTKLLVFAGSALTLSLAIAIGYTGCTNHAIYKDIDENVAASSSLSYYLHLAAAGYLLLVTLLGCYAAYYDQKHTIRALAVITSVNFVLALAAIAMNPSAPEVTGKFEQRLKDAAERYSFNTSDSSLAGQTDLTQTLSRLQQQSNNNGNVMNSTSPRAKREVKRMDAREATKIWDSLQGRGCCGWTNATDTWKAYQLPKSCCSNATERGDEWICKEVDAAHQQGCLSLIGSTSLHELIVLALIALANLYLAIITGISAYRTFHYNEASQTAYN